LKHNHFFVLCAKIYYFMGPLPFPPDLNSAFLNELYADDAEYATLMFGLFLDTIVPQVQELGTLIGQQDWPGLQQAAHKVKPTFGMVGLTQLAPVFDQLETSTDPAHALDLLNTIQTTLAEVLPVVQSTYVQLKNLQHEN
jgi:HPt (histidine-containing phosphotransfer) domain-containing protein